MVWDGFLLLHWQLVGTSERGTCMRWPRSSTHKSQRVRACVDRKTNSNDINSCQAATRLDRRISRDQIKLYIWRRFIDPTESETSVLRAVAGCRLFRLRGPWPWPASGELCCRVPTEHLRPAGAGAVHTPSILLKQL
jgi:hypothetical protein